MPTLQQYLSTAEVAARLDVDRRTIHRMVDRGELTAAAKGPGIRGALLFDPADVAALQPARPAS